MEPISSIIARLPNASDQNPMSCGRHLQQSTNLVSKYGNATEMMKRFNPQAQLKAVAYELQMFQPDRFPRLSDVLTVHGREIVIDWLIIQLDDAMNSSGVTTMKARTEQITDLAYVIYAKYHYLTLPELLLFFFKFKNGDFGDFNGVFNQQRFMKAFITFRTYRSQMLQQYEAKAKQQRTNTPENETMSRSCYEALKRINKQKQHEHDERKD